MDIEDVKVIVKAGQSVLTNTDYLEDNPGSAEASMFLDMSWSEFKVALKKAMVSGHVTVKEIEHLFDQFAR